MALSRNVTGSLSDTWHPGVPCPRMEPAGIEPARRWPRCFQLRFDGLAASP